MAEEIEDVIVNWFLPMKVETSHLFITEMFPKLYFALCAVIS
jgi:hypothetical protein